MGILYRARDTRLDRDVAIKVLRADAATSPARAERFSREAKAASALNHRNIVTVYDIGCEHIDGRKVDYIVMEYITGQSLAGVLEGPSLSVETAREYALQISEAIAAAHEAGIIHRDVKPANVMVTEKGEIKVLDFGLAKLLERDEVDSSAATMSAGLKTEVGAVVGTAAYMSPEQAAGQPVDARSDVFSLGIVLYEMLTGARPFKGDSQVSIRAAILSDTPTSPRAIAPSVPKALEHVVLRCLEKNRDARFASGGEVVRELRETGEAKRALRASAWVAIAAAVSIAIFAGMLLFRTDSRVDWARDIAMPEIEQLTQNEQYFEARRLLQDVMGVLADDPEVQRLLERASLPGTVVSSPSGAEVFIKGYREGPERPWLSIGITPLESVPIPAETVRWRFEKPGYEPVELSRWWFVDVTLTPVDEAPRRMVRVDGGTFSNPNRRIEPVELGPFWIDKYEVTNAEYQAFVDAGGYREKKYWRHAFVDGDTVLNFEDATSRFRDRTGRLGPATWELGSYAEGKESYPVQGVSWYEAAAYAEFVGKSLPTLYHWFHAAGTYQRESSVVVLESNMQSGSVAEVGAYRGLGRFGTYDAAGNVSEWCFNEAGGSRWNLGGAWSDTSYVYTNSSALPPMDRSETNGFRCVRYGAELEAKLVAELDVVAELSIAEPVDDATFRLFESFYSYDATALHAELVSVDDASPFWREEKVVFDAAYGDERVIAYLFLPKDYGPPFQSVVYFPGTAAWFFRTHEQLMTRYHWEFLARSGRAVVLPIYKGSYERHDDVDASLPSGMRDHYVQWSKDLRRTIDYLETREDIDLDKLAYYGLSRGAGVGPVMVALEPRFRAAVFLAGGLSTRQFLPEGNPVNFYPRVTVPVLMINGSRDYGNPVEESQKVMFDLLGTPDEQKRHAVFDSGHLPPRNDTIRETLDWLDRHLGAVQR